MFSEHGATPYGAMVSLHGAIAYGAVLLLHYIFALHHCTTPAPNYYNFALHNQDNSKITAK
jgi:hypothetical protein